MVRGVKAEWSAKAHACLLQRTVQQKCAVAGSENIGAANQLYRTVAVNVGCRQQVVERHWGQIHPSLSAAVVIAYHVSFTTEHEYFGFPVSVDIGNGYALSVDIVLLCGDGFLQLASDAVYDKKIF